MPRKKRQLKAELRKEGFREDKDRGKGSHTTWFHPALPGMTVIIAGHDGDDAKSYDEKNVREAVAEVRRRLS